MIASTSTLPPRSPAAPSVEDRVVERSRRAQRLWADVPLGRRLRVVAAFRASLARQGKALAGAIGRPSAHGVAESLVAEVIPLADACRWLEREAGGVLAPRRVGRRGRPAWLRGVRGSVRREPLGVVLVLAPSNYPLLLPGVQALQALAAGNAVLVKPAPGCSAPMQRVGALLVEAGLDPDLFVVLDEEPAVARRLMRNGVDKVVLTGSAATGRAVLAELANALTPAVMELSGCDAVFVRDDADLEEVARAVGFGLTLNAGATCIAPRRIFVSSGRARELESALGRVVAGLREPVPDPRHVAGALPAIHASLEAGARLVCGDPSSDAPRWPVVLADVVPSMAVAREDLFVPVVSIMPAEDDDDALAKAARCPYALGASVFGERRGAERLAARVRAGLVTVNDLIVPSADPRLPFGGRGESGFGVTRGPEGLLAMTAPKAVAVRGGRSRPHYESWRGGEDAFFAAWLEASHGGTWRERLKAMKDLVKAGRALLRARRPDEGARGESR